MSSSPLGCDFVTSLLTERSRNVNEGKMGLPKPSGLSGLEWVGVGWSA